jgi:hypothetical protein
VSWPIKCAQSSLNPLGPYSHTLSRATPLIAHRTDFMLRDKNIPMELRRSCRMYFYQSRKIQVLHMPELVTIFLITAT